MISIRVCFFYSFWTCINYNKILIVILSQYFKVSYCAYARKNTNNNHCEYKHFSKKYIKRSISNILPHYIFWKNSCLWWIPISTNTSSFINFILGLTTTTAKGKPKSFTKWILLICFLYEINSFHRPKSNKGIFDWSVGGIIFRFFITSILIFLIRFSFLGVVNKAIKFSSPKVVLFFKLLEISYILFTIFFLNSCPC